jgi:hypothetical protein
MFNKLPSNSKGKLKIYKKELKMLKPAVEYVIYYIFLVTKFIK